MSAAPASGDITDSSSTDPKKLIPVTETSRETTLTLAAAHALVLLEDGTIVGDPMEKTTLAALDWKLNKGDNIGPNAKDAPHRSAIHIRRRYQFSSALKRMSTVSGVTDASGRKWVAAVKGAPETLKGMYNDVPAHYDETYRYYTRRGSRVLALGIKTMNIQPDQVGGTLLYGILSLTPDQPHLPRRGRVQARVRRILGVPLPAQARRGRGAEDAR